MFDLNSVIKIIKIGTCALDPGNAASQLRVNLKNQLGVGGGSTVSFIRDAGEGILVDTGYDFETDRSETNDEANWDRLSALLRLNGISLGSITKVFVTHFHRDHYGLIHHFENAQWICGASELENYSGRLKKNFHAAEDAEKITPNTSVVFTPGHTKGHASLLVSAADGKVKIALSGDAVINLAWLQSGYTWRFNSDFDSVENAERSAERIIYLSDIVIPGHGQPFFTAELKNTRKMK